MVAFVTYGGSYFQKFLKSIVFTFQPVNTCENMHLRAMCRELNSKAQVFDRHKIVEVIGEQAGGAFERTQEGVRPQRPS